MRRTAVLTALVIGALTLFAGLGSGTAAAGTKKLVEGTVYNASCGTACSPCPPPCGGPIPVPQSRADVICAQKQIVCPLAQADRGAAVPDFCIQGQPCGVDYPLYTAEGAKVTLRNRRTGLMGLPVPVVGGHFKARVAPGNYAIRVYIPPEPQCWSGGPVTLKVTAKMKSPIPASVDVTNSCVVHPDAAR